MAINRTWRNSQFEGFIEGHSTEDILKAVSDTKSLAMFRSIANGSVESEVLKRDYWTFQETILLENKTTIENRINPEK